MTTFTDTWNAAFKATPAEDEDARLGAMRIRELKRALDERLVVDHSTAGTAEDGAHKKVTLLEQATNPGTVANTGYLYTKDVAGVTELFWYDSAGAIVQLTSAGVLKGPLPAADVVGTALVESAIGTTVQGYNAEASQAEMVAGTEPALRSMSPLRVAQANANVTTTANNALAGGHYGQTWQAVSRAIGTTYTNSTGKPIQVKVVLTAGSNDHGFYVGAVLVDRSSAYGGAGMYPQLSGIVPNGATYKVVLLSGSGTLLYWRELR